MAGEPGDCKPAERKRGQGMNGGGVGGGGGRILGAAGRCKPPPTSMEDLIYNHRRKTRKTVYQKSYRAGSDSDGEKERRKREEEMPEEKGARDRKRVHDGRNEIVRAWITVDFVIPSN